MNLEKLKWWFTTRRIYLIASTLFVVWMIFFDGDNMLKQRELYAEIQSLKDEKEFLEQENARTLEQKEVLGRPGELERFARETYLFHKENEDILLIEYADSLDYRPASKDL